MGIDLAWKVTPPKEQGTDHCIVDEQDLVTEIGLLTTDEEIIELATDEDSWIGLDVSLKVPADRSIRNCERELRSLGLRALPTSRAFYQRHYGGAAERSSPISWKRPVTTISARGRVRSSRSTLIQWRSCCSLLPSDTRKVLLTSAVKVPRPFYVSFRNGSLAFNYHLRRCLRSWTGRERPIAWMR